MRNSTCTHGWAWLNQPEQLWVPPQRLMNHIAGCPCCRGRLFLLIASYYELRVHASDPHSCAACEHHLAAYVDLEQEAGSSRAARAYPWLWWHLWLCPNCAELYHLLTILHVAAPAILDHNTNEV